MSTPANFNGKKPMIDPDDSAMLLIDIESYNKAQEVWRSTRFWNPIGDL